MAKKCTATCMEIRAPKIYQFFVDIGSDLPVCIEAEKYSVYGCVQFNIGEEAIATFSQNNWKSIVRGKEVKDEYELV